jgi:hypothetical protein
MWITFNYQDESPAIISAIHRSLKPRVSLPPRPVWRHATET